MAEKNSAAHAFSQLPISKQIGLLVGLAASITLAAVIVLWSIEPTYRPLYSDINGKDAHEIVDVLQRNGFEFEIDRTNGAILVAAKDIHDARMKLAAEGLPRGNGQGFEIFNKESGFASSQFMETARYRHALESELARTITNFSHIKGARVHLAIPKQTSFLRDKQDSSASVFIDVYRGRELSSSTIASVVNLVASSVPGLTPERVTVVDQKGTLLNEGGGNSPLAMADRLLDYQAQIESAYTNRIQTLLTPIIGIGKVKANVSADIDFTSSEQTREMYNPDLPALRSEQSFVEQRASGGSEARGVPGITSSSPPQTQAVNANESTQTNEPAPSSSSDVKRQSTKNFELDKTISHTKHQPGRIRRLTVAVLVANKTTTDQDGKTTSAPLSEDEIKRLKSLVSNAIGINPQRGDSIDIISTAFAEPDPIEKPPELSLWEQPWVWDLSKQIAGGLFVLIMLFGVLRPAIKKLANNPLPEPGSVAMVGPNGQPLTPEQQKAMQGLPAPEQTFEDRMGVVQNMASADPKRVAQVVKTWVDGS